jgi:hypothetical protein
MTRSYRICPTNKLIIEWQLSGEQWGFFRVCDSPQDAKRSLSVLRGDTEQMDLLTQGESQQGEGI